MAKIFIITTAYLLDLSDRGGAEIDEFALERPATEALWQGALEVGRDVYKWSGGSLGWYDTEVNNIGKCATCGAWTTDYEAEDPIQEIQAGAKVDGLLYCDEHLPKDHKWAF